MLGNKSIKQIEDRCGIKFPEPLRDELLKARQENVAKPIEKGRWHCFDLPFVLVVGGEELLEKVKETLLPLASEFKVPLGLSQVK